MTIYILIHHEHGNQAVREVYATRALAEADQVTRTPSGRRSSALDAHDERCCEIEEWEVEGFIPVYGYDTETWAKPV